MSTSAGDIRALKTTRRLYCRGDNLSGALGNCADDPTLANQSRPVEVFAR